MRIYLVRINQFLWKGGRELQYHVSPLVWRQKGWPLRLLTQTLISFPYPLLNIYATGKGLVSSCKTPLIAHHLACYSHYGLVSEHIAPDLVFFPTGCKLCFSPCNSLRVLLPQQQELFSSAHTNTSISDADTSHRKVA